MDSRRLMMIAFGFVVAGLLFTRNYGGSDNANANADKKPTDPMQAQPIADEEIAADPADDKEFARTTIDMGMVVQDVEKSAKFYKEVIGFQDAKPFTAPAELCKKAGLTDGQELNIRVLVLGDDPTATKLKLMRVPDIQPSKKDTTFVPNQTGVRYITIFVNDTSAAMERLNKAGLKPLAEGPVALPKSLAEGVFLTVVRDPDGNMVELVGPKK